MSNDTIDEQLPERGEPNLNPIAFKFGIISGFVGVLSSLALYFANVEYSSLWKWLPMIFMIIIIIISLRQIAEENKNYTISFGALFKAGMIITLVTAIIMVVYFIIYANFIEPNFIDKILEVTKENLATKGLSEDQVDAALEMSKKFMSPTIMAVTSLISNLIIGAIAAAIGAGIFKNEK